MKLCIKLFVATASLVSASSASARIGIDLLEGGNTVGPITFDETNDITDYWGIPVFGDNLVNSDLYLDSVIFQISDFSPGTSGNLEIILSIDNVTTGSVFSSNGTFVLDSISNPSAQNYYYEIRLTGDITGASGTMQLDYIVVPEPSSLALLSLGGLALMRRRRRV